MTRLEPYREVIGAPRQPLRITEELSPATPKRPFVVPGANPAIGNGLCRVLLRTQGCRTVLLVGDKKWVRRISTRMLKPGLGGVVASQAGLVAGVGARQWPLP